MTPTDMFQYGDFGAFDPRFFGIILKFNQFEKYKLFSELLVQDKYGDVGFEEIWLITVLNHEHRHFHDSLLSPTAGNLMSLRLNNIANGLPLISKIRKAYSEKKSNLLPLPLLKWINLSKDEKEYNLNLLRNFTKHKNQFKLAPVYFPGLNQTSQTAAKEKNLEFLPELILINQNYNVMRDLLIAESEGPSGTITPRDIYELSAISIQYHASYKAIGEEAASTFIKSIFIHAPGYIKCFELMLKVWSKNDRGPDRVFSLFSTWCILGNRVLEHKKNNYSDYKDTKAGCPAYRFITILSYFENNGIPNSDISTEELFQDWDREVKSSTWKECLEYDLKSCKERHEVFEKAALDIPTNGPAKDLYSLLARISKMIYNDKKSIQKIFLKNPDEYALPRDYYDLKTLPDAPTWLTFNDFFIEKGKSPSENYLEILSHTDSGESFAQSIILKNPQYPYEVIEDIKLVYEYNCLMDYLFASFHRDEAVQFDFSKFLPFDCLDIF